MGDANAQRMLGRKAEAIGMKQEAGLIQWATSQADLMTEPKIAKGWVAEGATRTYRGSTKQELKEVNALESVALADAFLAAPL